MSELERIRVCQVLIRRRHGADDGGFLLNVVIAEVEYHTLDIIWLITLRNLCHTRKVNEGEVDDRPGEELHKNLLVADGLVVAALTRRVVLDLITRLRHIKVLLAGFVRELNPILGCRWRIYQLDYNGAARHDICSARQEITAADVLE